MVVDIAGHWYLIHFNLLVIIKIVKSLIYSNYLFKITCLLKILSVSSRARLFLCKNLKRIFLNKFQFKTIVKNQNLRIFLNISKKILKTNLKRKTNV